MSTPVWRWMGRRETSLLAHVPTEKAGFLCFLPFSLSLTNKSAHITSLLDTLKWLLFALRKKSDLLSRNSKVPLVWFLLLLWPHFAQSHRLLSGPWAGSAHSCLSDFVLVMPSHAGSIPPLGSQLKCRLLRETFPYHPVGKPPSSPLCLTVVSLFFIVPFTYIWNDLVYSYADCLIGIWTSR